METRHTPTSDFAEEISQHPAGEGINKCVQCGICTASCIVATYKEKYRPRKLIQKILLGEREEVLKSELPWLCMTCRLCEERCQEDVSIAEIFHVVREIAAKEGYIPNTFKKTVDTVLNDGWLLKDSYSDMIMDDRADLGLNPELEWNRAFPKKLKEVFYEEGSK